MREPADDLAGADFSALLKRFRVESGLSQQTLAGRALVSVQAISALERGYRKAPYRDTLERLADALGLRPDARTALETAAARARERGPRVGEHELLGRSHNLPRQLTTFLGGDAIVAELAALVSSSPLVTVTGTGGAGKTRAAIEAGERLCERYQDGVWFVELARVAAGTPLEGAVATALGVQEMPRRPLLDTLVAYLEDKHLVLILDNCEHVIVEARRVAASLLRACPSLRVLATSRERLAIPGERAYKIPPLAFPHAGALTAEQASSYGAVSLFVDRASRADGSFYLTDGNAAAVAEICRRVDGLPLAIELAAARVTVLSPRQLADRLDRVFSVLSGGDSTSLPRHQTMRAAIDWSYSLLSARARALLDRLSVFAGPFTLDGATAVCSDQVIERTDVLDLLASLVDKSLVVADFARGDACYHLLESTRQYALERLDESGERHASAGRHARVYLALAEGLDQDWYTVPEQGWFEQTQISLDNWRAALDWSLRSRHDVDVGQRLAGALARVWYAIAPAEGRRWVRTALETSSDVPNLSVAARLELANAELHGAVGEYETSLGAAERALAVLHPLGGALQTARAQKAVGAALAALGRGMEGEALLAEAAATARALGNHRLRATVLGDLGTARSRRGDLDGARGFYAEALAVYTTLGFDRPAASIAGHLAEIEFASGDPLAAIARAEEALAGHARTNNRRSVANDLCNLAAYLIALDQYDDALSSASEALMLSYDVRATALTAFALQHLAALFALRPAATSLERERAARLLGFVEERLAALGARREHTEQREYDRVFAALEDSLDVRALDALLADGRDWSEDRAVAEALAV